MTMHFGDDEDENADEKKGGPETGNYEPPKDLPIPGETESMDNSQQ